MRKKQIFTIILLLISFCTIILTGCGNSTVNQLQNDYGIMLEGGSFEKESILVSNEVALTTTEGQEVLDMLASKEYNKNGKIFILDIYVLKDDKKIQPEGKVKLTIPVPDESINDYLIFHIKNNSEIDDIIPRREGSYFIIEIESFSYFAIVQTTHVHEYNSVVTPPTCTEQGYTTYTCSCGDSYVDPDKFTNPLGHKFDNGVVTKEPNHYEEGIKTYTCTECGTIKEEAISKSDAHLYTEWYPDQTTENKHIRECKCGAKETGDCTFDNGVVTQKPSHVEEGIKTYTCTECGRTKEESIDKTNDHLFGNWIPDQTTENKHIRECKCGEKETGDCTFDNGVVTQKPSHVEEGIKTYTCTECGRTKEESIEKTNDHLFGNWIPDQTTENKHIRECKCGEKETGTCTFDNGVITKEPTHLEEGIKTYTCKDCGRTKEESIDKTNDHLFGNWAPDQTTENKHIRECKCGEKETGDCTFDNGVITKEPSHFEEGIKTYTCKDCGRTKEEQLSKTSEHIFSPWSPDFENDDKHIRTCKCGEKETGTCTFDNGVITKEPTHLEEGIKTYTCKDCGRTKEELIAKIQGHSFGEWTPDKVSEDKHVRECKCGEKETGDCTFDNGNTDAESGLTIYTCTICGRKKSGESGYIIVIAGGSATFEGTETVTSNSKIYGENVNVYIAQENDVLNVLLKDQAGRTFKYWVSATGTVIPDEDFSLLVLRSGYYYPVFEDTDTSEFSKRKLVYEGNCEEGILYMSTNSKGDIKYELEFINNGQHDFYQLEKYDNEYHKIECTICGEIIYEEHNESKCNIEEDATHTKEGKIKYQCECGYEWTESIPVTAEHSIDYDEWHIVEKSENGKYGKYQVFCEYCDYHEEYWYLNTDIDFIGFVENKMIQYQATYGGKVTHDEYYYCYRNAEGKKVYIWALQYEYDYSSNKDYNDTYIFMYIDDENSKTLEPIYLSKSRGDRRAEYLWAIYGYAYDANGWIEILDSPDLNIGCNDGMLLGNSMSARSSVFESYHDYWAETYNELRIPTSKEYNDLSGTPWEIYYEGKSLGSGYYDENDQYISTGGIDCISYVKNNGTSYKKYMHVIKDSGITYGYEDWGTSYRSIYIMRSCKNIVSPTEYDALDAAGKSISYSYGDIEKDIKSLCSKRTLFNNFTLTLPETITSFRLLFSDPIGCVEVSGSNTNVYYNSAHVYNSGDPITFTWQDEEGIVFDRYEIWDFENQKWILLSNNPTYKFNTSDNPRREAAYVRVVCHEVDVPVVPGETYRISVENGYFEIDGKEYHEAMEVAANTHVYLYANNVAGKTFDHWVDNNGNEFFSSSFTVTANVSLKPVYVDTKYNIYVSGWNYDSYVSVNGGENHYTDEFEGKIGDSFTLSTTPVTDSECTVFIGWYIETYGLDSLEYILISDKQSFTYVIENEVYGSLYAVWTTGENPFIKTYVDIRAENGFVMRAGGEASRMFDNAYSVISVSNSGRINIYDDPTDENIYTVWDVTFKYEIDGEIVHSRAESYQYDYDFYPAEFWVDDPKYNYPDGVINVTGIIDTNSDLELGEVVLLP